MADKKIVLYSTPTWPYCKKVKEYLSQKGMSFVEHDVVADHSAAKEMIEKTKQMAVPAIIIDDKDIVIGFNTARLDELLAA